MKRGLALALLTLATSAGVSAQSFGPGRPNPGVRASSIAMGPLGSSRGFGHPAPFRSGVRNHRRFSPTYYYWPYYGYYDYPYGDYYADAYPQQSAVVDPPLGDNRYGDHSFRQRSSPPPQAKAQPAQEQDPTVLVFRDGHKQEVRNYAIVGQMLWDFGANGTHKIPLSDLDLDTTRKLNDERGVDFVLPKT